MGLKEEAVQEIGFSRLAIFRPGIIGGNVHTTGWVAALGSLIPGSWGPSIRKGTPSRSMASAIQEWTKRGLTKRGQKGRSTPMFLVLGEKPETPYGGSKR